MSQDHDGETAEDEGALRKDATTLGQARGIRSPITAALDQAEDGHGVGENCDLILLPLAAFVD